MTSATTASCLVIAPSVAEWQTTPLPLLGPHDILVRTRTGAISLGTEIPIYTGTGHHAVAPAYPLMTGYESVGIIESCGAEVTTLHAGDRVVCFYGHRERWVLPASSAIVVPDHVSDALAVLSILTCDVAKGIHLLRSPLEKVILTGGGAIGLLTLFVLKALGVAQVDVVEPQGQRHPLARRLGASRVWTAEQFAMESEQYAVGFECSSRNAAFTLLQQHLQRYGEICILADGNLEPLELTTAFHARELRVAASSDGWDYHEHAEWYFSWLAQHTTSLELIFELRVAAADLPAVFAQAAQPGKRPVKILVEYEA